MRPQKPDDLAFWEGPPPQYCHNCDHYSKQGACLLFKMKPPDEWVNKRDACNKWEWWVPF